MTAASTVMTRTVVFCRPDDALQEVWSIMKERRLKNVPIVDQDIRPLGVLNARAALEALLANVEHEVSLLRDYVMSAGQPETGTVTGRPTAVARNSAHHCHRRAVAPDGN